MNKIISVLTLIATAFLAVSVTGAADDCPSCHGRKGTSRFVDIAAYQGSVHGKFSCNSCHLDIVRYPHGTVSQVNCVICHFTGDRGAPRVKEFKFSVHDKAIQQGSSAAPNCQTCHGSHEIYPAKDDRSATARQKIPSLCGQCHAGEYEEYERSVHGKALLEEKNLAAATCFDCHLEHLVPKVDEEGWRLSLIRQCGRCHAEEMSTYRKTFHGKVTRLGYTTVAKCADCHGSHGILRVKDRNSKLSESNIVSTCRGGNCHPKATARFTRYYAHAEESDRKKYPVLYYTYLFMTILLISVFSFFFIHTFLWAYRALRERIEGNAGREK
ncbi:MAG TPA: cytochrome c3 family protein [Thermodesulfovibrionales bacterium]|nr:cytochrome c3 family protein [Thermodesulfovibrionales bacterium]